jgi:hypothetical protein
MRALVKCISLFSLLIMLSGCWEKNYEYDYTICLANLSKDTVNMLIGKTTLNTTEHSLYNIVIAPNDTLNGNESGLYGFETNEYTNAIEHRFQTGWNIIDTVHIYRNDSLKVEWTYPARSAPVEEHDFFNYNSWVTTVIDNTRAILFTIYESDFEQ